MRIALVSPPPGATLVDKFAWVADGFRAAGHEVARVHTLEGLSAADSLADLVLFDQKGAGLNHNSIANESIDRRAKWACWWRDLIAWDPVTLAEQDDLKLFLRMMRRMDVVFVKERSHLPEFAQLGINARWLDQACPTDIGQCEYAESLEFDVLVLGRTDYPQRRADVTALVAAGYSVLWASLPDSCGVPEGVTAHPWVHPTQELPALASRCACALSVDMVHRPGYTSDRTYLLAGRGIPVVARVPETSEDLGLAELAEVAPQADVASWIYSDTEGLLRCVGQAVEDLGEARRRAAQGRRRVLERHTYRQRAEKIVEVVT